MKLTPRQKWAVKELQGGAVLKTQMVHPNGVVIDIKNEIITSELFRWLDDMNLITKQTKDGFDFVKSTYTISHYGKTIEV